MNTQNPLPVLILLLGTAEAPCLHAAPPPATTTSPAVSAVESIALTVSDLDRSLTFYRDILGFALVGSIEERSGDAWEHVYGVFGARVRVATLQLGEERLQLEQFLAPVGRPIPADSHSNDRSFQHVALIVSDMDRAYAWLRGHGVSHASTALKHCPSGIPMPAASPRSTSVTLISTIWKSCIFLLARVTRSGNAPAAVCFWA